MLKRVSQWLGNFSNKSDAYALLQLLNPIADSLSSQSLSSAGLAIKAGGSALVKAGSTYYGVAKGKLVKVASSTDMPALVGTVTADAFNVYCFFVDAAGTVTSAMGVEGASLDAVQFPPIPSNQALIGFVVVNPTGTGDFVGGTTALDDATVVPNAAYVNTVGAFDPSVLL